MSEIATFRILLANGQSVDEFFWSGRGEVFNELTGVWTFTEDQDKNNFQKIKQITGISFKIKAVKDSSGKIKSDFLEKRRILMERVYGQLAIFILETMNSIIWLKNPKVAGVAGNGGVLSEIGLERALVYALDIAEKMFELYKEIVNINYPSGVSQDITKLDRDEFIADKRKEFGIIKSKKDK